MKELKSALIGRRTKIKGEKICSGSRKETPKNKPVRGFIRHLFICCAKIKTTLLPPIEDVEIIHFDNFTD